MPFNGAGTFTLVAGNPVITGTTISSTWANNTLSDITANGLTNCLTKDGQQTPTNNIPMGGFRITGLGAGTVRTDAAQLGQVQDSTISYITAVAGTDTITGVTSPVTTSYVAGQTYRFISAGANTTSTVTLNLNSLGAKAVTQLGASALQPGAIQSGAVVTVIYDGTQFQAIGINNGTGVVGNARNAKMLVTTAGNTGTFTATEVVVETVLGGVAYRLPNYSQAINLGTTGAGGMDTGLAPVSGYVALYAIYNGTTGTASILAQTVSGVMPEVYGGANMPSGYTASALLSIWPTNASRQFVIGLQNDRKFDFSLTTALSSSTAQGAVTTLGVSSIVPANARTVSGQLSGFVNTAAASFAINLFIASVGAGNVTMSANPAATGAACQSQFTIDLSTAQTLFYTSSISGGTYTYVISIMSYWI
jgi:hypothetical protein